MGDAVASVLAQTRPVEEIICVDDGSTDDTLAVLHRLQAESPIPFHVLSGPNGGPSAARNRGLERARGAWIQFLDADDLLAPDKLRHQLALVRAADVVPGFVAATYRAVYIESGKERISSVAQDPWVGLLTAQLGTPSANLWRADAVRSVGGWRRGMHTSEDPDLMFRLLQAGVPVLRDTTCLTTLRRRPDSQWNRDLRASYTGWFAFRQEVVNHMREAGLLTPERAAAFGEKVWATLRRLYQQDPALAVELYVETRAGRLPVSREEERRLVRLLYAMLGFSATEKLRLALAEVRPRASHFVRHALASTPAS